ncbi:chorismate mutase [Actinoplanes cyaneus]|uniref:chorismate mutase n=1 Tax=Actinoplanes cyaneus TaxID=52696 RepID=A0A919MB47_9ACTN|nr:chorismate mutase [Actinoplanes cyaneus]MCW2142227.1 chorismate mutase [Actinoplanes cyaneus]GID69244.1 chorismate mutase [Actinoplanes cyaneus]
MLRAIRGATQLEADDRDLVLEATIELVNEVVARNGLMPDDVVSVIFTSTPDLTAAFPAAAARKIGFGDVPLLCATEIDVPGALPRVVRMLAHVETDLRRDQIRHIYLRGAVALRPDLGLDSGPDPALGVVGPAGR